MLQNKKTLTFYIFIALLLAVPRFLFLDQDIPSTMIGGMCQEDEPYYCIGGVNRYLADEKRIYEPFAKENLELLQILNTPTTYASFKMLGNTYYGLRLPVAVISTIVVLLMVAFAYRQGLSGGKMAVLLFFLSTDFYTILIGRFYNPQEFCILFISLILFLLFYKKKENLSKMRLLLIGFLAAFIVLGVYIYTIYFAGALFAWFFWMAVIKKEWKAFAWVCLGGITGLLVWISYIFILDIQFKELFGNLMAHGGGVETETNAVQLPAYKKLMFSFLQIVSTNFFRYNLFLLGVFVLILGYCIRTFRTNKYSLLFLLILFFFLAQNYFVLSYPFKKHVIFFPVLVFFALKLSKDILDWLRSSKTGIRVLMSFVFAGLAYYNFKLNNSAQYWSGFNYGYYENIPMMFAWISLLLSCTFVLFILLPELFVRQRILTILVLIWILPSAYMTLNEFFVKKTFFARDSLTDMRSEVKGKYILKEFSHAVQIYSDGVPVMSNYNRVLLAKTDQGKLYRELKPYVVLKRFRNDPAIADEAKNNAGIVRMDSLDFYFVKQYKLRYYDYCLLKYKEPDSGE